MIALIAGLSFLSLWFGMALVYSDRRHRRVMADRDAERDYQRQQAADTRADMQMWAQRVQAPEIAPHQHAAQTQAETPPTSQHVPWDDDNAYWAATIGVNPLEDGSE